MGILLLALFLLGVAAIWSFRTLARKSFLKGREPRQLTEIYSEVEDQVSLEVFNQVWLRVGDAFTIDPRLIKPDDTLKVLGSIDSWDLGKGEDALHQWIAEEHLGYQPTLTTVIDLARWVQTRRMNKS